MVTIKIHFVSEVLVLKNQSSDGGKKFKNFCEDKGFIGAFHFFEPDEMTISINLSQIIFIEIVNQIGIM